MLADVDREMRCADCGYRCFTSDAPQLIAEGSRCPRCGTALELVPAPPAPPVRHYAYPRVTEHAGSAPG
jgi:DNA-directed RNA polymerase subunit RPC12/RpoP